MEDILNLQIFSEGESAETEALSEAEDSAEALGEEFERLIKGKYADAFRDRTQGIIDKRFAKMKGFEKTAKAVSPLLTELTARFPSVDKSDTEGLVRAFLEEKNSDSVSSGKEKEDILSSPEVMAEIERAAKSSASKRLIECFTEESERLREIYPSFDLNRELDSSPDFRKLIEAGVPLRRAFEAVNLENILGTALRYAVVKARSDVAQAMKNNDRVSENSVRDTASSVKRTDVNSLTEKEIMKIISQVSRGAKISF